MWTNRGAWSPGDVLRTLLLAPILVAAACTAPAEDDTAGGEYAQDSRAPRPKYELVLDSLEKLAEGNREWVTSITYGASRNGLPLRVVKIAAPGSSDTRDNPAVLITGATHGHEYLGIEDRLPQWFVDHRSTKKELRSFFDAGGLLYIVPVFNPDGFEAGTRGNANRADLNRDFIDAPKQPETLYLTEWLPGELERSHAKLRLTFDYHCCQGSLVFPDHLRPNAVDDHRRIAEIMRRDVSPDYTYGNVLEVLGYSVTNDSIDYYHTRYGSLSFAMEGRLADSSGRSEDFERHASMWSHILEYVASMPAPEPR